MHTILIGLLIDIDVFSYLDPTISLKEMENILERLKEEKLSNEIDE